MAAALASPTPSSLAVAKRGCPKVLGGTHPIGYPPYRLHQAEGLYPSPLRAS